MTDIQLTVVQGQMWLVLYSAGTRSVGDPGDWKRYLGGSSGDWLHLRVPLQPVPHDRLAWQGGACGPSAPRHSLCPLSSCLPHLGVYLFSWSPHSTTTAPRLHLLLWVETLFSNSEGRNNPHYRRKLSLWLYWLTPSEAAKCVLSILWPTAGFMGQQG